MERKKIKKIIREETGKVLNEVNSSLRLDVMSDDECMNIIRQLNNIADRNNMER